MKLFLGKWLAAIVLFGVSFLFGTIPIAIKIEMEKYAKTISKINCLCGGFLLGSVLFEMLFEATEILEDSMGHYPSSYLLFGMGYVFIMFFEKWIHVITFEYNQQKQKSTSSTTEVIRYEKSLEDKKEVIKSSNITAYILSISSIIENIISSFGIGTQVNVNNLWTVTIVIVLTEWIQMFIFVFQFRQCKQGILIQQQRNEIQMQTFSYENSDKQEKEENDSGDEGLITIDGNFTTSGIIRDRQERSIKIETFVNVMIISLTNVVGIFVGILFSNWLSDLSTSSTISTDAQNICAGLLLAFVAGIFLHIATNQMIAKEFEQPALGEYELLIMSMLIIAGLLLSSVSSVLMKIIVIVETED